MRRQKLDELQTYIDELQTAQKLKSKEVNKFLSIETYDCYLNNGKKIVREKVVKNNCNGDAAIILPLTKENNTILTVQPRVFTKSSVGVELPAGYIEKDEDKYTAALRELQEETGYVPEEIKLLTSYYQDQGCMSAYNHSFIALNCEKKHNQELDPGEFIRYFECSYDEALELIDLGYIQDVNSIITLEKAKNYIKGVNNMKEFNAEEETKKIVKFIRDYYQENNVQKAILGISGGKDSAVVAALMVEALGKENVLGVTLPCHSNIEDKTDAKLIRDYYGFNLINFDLTATFDTFKNELPNLGQFRLEELKNSDINLKPRLRMATLYYLAALYSKLNNKTYLVAGTSNKCELFVGYFTKGGDSVHDIAPIADLTVDEVIKVGEYLKVPEKVLYKKPNDGLSNQSDEEKLGVKYSDVASFMEDETSVDETTRIKIKRLHENNLHKFNTPTYRK